MMCTCIYITNISGTYRFYNYKIARKEQDSCNFFFFGFFKTTTASRRLLQSVAIRLLKKDLSQAVTSLFPSGRTITPKERVSFCSTMLLKVSIFLYINIICGKVVISRDDNLGQDPVIINIASLQIFQIYRLSII